MGRNTSVVLSDHFLQFVDEQVESGRYGSASDVVRAGLRLLEEREITRGALREALMAGETSGEATAFDLAAFLTSKRTSVAGA
jgi:antitoxin ParD1/3/4